MARVKATIPQRDFSRMEVREDFLEGDDLELRRQSLRAARNMRSLATRATEIRPGLFYERTLISTAYDVIEISPTASLTFGLVLNDASFEIIDTSFSVVHTENTVPWTSAADVWVVPYRDETVIGGAFGIKVLRYSAGTWSFEDFAFTDAPGGELAQPYWAYEENVTLTPSARTGSITVTASSPIWTDDYIGLRVRYGQREIEITSRVSTTVVNGTVINELPPTLNITIADAAGFRTNEAVIGADTNYQGIVLGIAANVLTVLTISGFEGPDVGEDLVCANSASAVSSKAEVSPQASVIWDEPLMSDARGWPRSATAISGRLVLLDFAAVPDAMALSSVRSIYDFETGTQDDDAIVRQVGDNSPRWYHAINASDLILLSDKGCYYVPTRDNGVITPSNFDPVLFDKRGSSPIRPVQVDDGVVFVESSGEHIAAAFLEGNVYLKWRAQTLTTLHNHLVNSPTKLCGQALQSREAEKYVFVVNGDGTLAAISWDENLTGGVIGFSPWETQGSFVSVSPVFGYYIAIVDRNTSAGTMRLLERFDEDAVMDSAVLTSSPSAFTSITDGSDAITDGSEDIFATVPQMEHIPGMTVSYGTASWYLSDYDVTSDGTVTDEPALTGEWQIGLPFTARLKPWPVELIDSRRVGMIKARVMRVSVSVQHTSSFSFVCNGKTRTVGGYSVGDDLDAPPELVTKVYTFPVFGSRDHPDFEIVKDTPGAFRVLAVTQEAQG